MTDEKRAAMHAAIDRAIDAVLAECPGALVTLVTAYNARTYVNVGVSFDAGDFELSYYNDSPRPWRLHSDEQPAKAGASLADVMPSVEVSDV